MLTQHIGMRRTGTLWLTLLQLAITGGPALQAQQKNFTVVQIHPSEEDLPSVLKAEALKAAKITRKPFAYFFADWCSPCKALRNSLGDPLMVDAFDGTYIIQLNADEWAKKLGSTGFSISAIPVLFEIDNNGERTGRKIDGGAWGANIPKNMAPPLKAFFRGSSAK